MRPRRNESMARRFAAVISQAPGLSGMPSSGQTSRAVTSASCASSSAMPISWVTRAIAAIRRVDSIFHTAAIVLWASLIRTQLPGQLFEPFRRLPHVLRKVRHLVNLADFDPLGVGHGCPLRPFDGLFA